MLVLRFLAFLLLLVPAPLWSQGLILDSQTSKGSTVATSVKDPENTLVMDLAYGRVIIEMRPDLAPKHVARIKELVRKGFYDGLTFHRVIDGFMAQGGDPRGDGTSGSGQNIPAEFSSAKHVRGTASMARAADPNSADSQFFLCLDTADFLDGQYTVWGQVTAGMEFVDKIKKGVRANNGSVDNPDKMIKVRVAADVKE
jgi:peptidylprolyl isomerase